MAHFYEDPIIIDLRRRERAKEDMYFSARDREILKRLHEQRESERRAFLHDLIRGHCPDCAARLARRTRHGVTVDECPRGHGMWITERKARLLVRRERDANIARYLYAPRPVI